MDSFRIDSHKLMFHPARVQQWLDGETIYPIYIEASLIGLCNQRCIFCAFDYLRHKPDFLASKPFLRFVRSAAAHGVKSILLAGSGEPLLHPDAADIVDYIRHRSIDVALATNGVLLTKETAGQMLPSLTWLRVSINAGCPGTYARVHGTRPEQFNTVLQNLETAMRIKRKRRLTCTVGAQYLLLRENYTEAKKLIGILKDIGLDYCVLKPYSQHPASINRMRYGGLVDDIDAAARRLARESERGFEIIYRREAMDHLRSDKPYTRCLGLDFTAVLSSDGDLYPCLNFVGNKRFAVGNINRDSFENIWNGDRRSRVMEYLRTAWDVTRCRKSCRLDAMNRYLWELKNPQPHVNFI